LNPTNLCRDLGGNMRFSGKVSTVKCFENNPLVRKVGDSNQPDFIMKPTQLLQLHVSASLAE